MFRKFIKFRIERVDTILQAYHPDPVLMSHYPMTLLNGFDKDGDGIWIERPGVADCSGLYDRFGRDELLRYCLWVREAACKSKWRDAYVAEKNQAPRLTCVVDLKGLNRGHMRPNLLPIFAEVIQDIQNYYCGFIKKIIIIRAPAIIPMVWRLVRHCFNANMRNLMVFAGSDYVKVLNEYIDDLEENLPPSMIDGGTGTIAEGMPQRIEGGPLPPKTSNGSSLFKSRGSTASLTDDETATSSQELSRSSSRMRRSPNNKTSLDAMNVQFNRITEYESMAVRCNLLAKGTF